MILVIRKIRNHAISITPRSILIMSQDHVIPGQASAESIRAAWAMKIAKRKEKLHRRKLHMIEIAKQCAKVLKNRYHAREVYLIGSLTRDRPIHERSDIDLVVAGLDDAIYFKILNCLYEIARDEDGSEIDIDLITLESATESMKVVVNTAGVRL